MFWSMFQYEGVSLCTKTYSIALIVECTGPNMKCEFNGLAIPQADP